MKNEAKIWLEYAKENLKSSKVLLESKLYNPCLQNIQQSVEKAIKAILIEKSIVLKKTHSINELKNNIKIDDHDVIAFFKRLSRAVYRLKNSSLEYDDVKQLDRFLWELFAGWNFVDGYRKDDIIRVMIDKI